MNATYDVLKKTAAAGALAGATLLAACSGAAGNQAFVPQAAQLQSASLEKPHAMVCTTSVAGCYTLIAPISRVAITNPLTIVMPPSNKFACGGTTIAASQPLAVRANGATVNVPAISLPPPCTSSSSAIVAPDAHSSAPTNYYIVAVPTTASSTTDLLLATPITGAGVVQLTTNTLQFASASNVVLPSGSVYFYFASCSACGG